MVVEWILSIISAIVLTGCLCLVIILSEKCDDKRFKRQVNYVFDEIEKRKNK